MSTLVIGADSSAGFDAIPWAPSEHSAGMSFAGSITTGDCMMYIVAATDKVSSHYIGNIDTAGANPGLALRYWQPSDDWFAYCNNAGSTGSRQASAAGTVANAKVLLGVRVSGATLSLSVNGALTTGGTATPFTATRGVINRDAYAGLTTYDVFVFPLYLESLAKRIEGFLAKKHGITLAAGHPYRVTAPTNAWNISDDPGLKIWYDFADSSTITIAGAGVSNLLNKASPGAFTLSQSTDADRPSWDGSKVVGRGTGSGLSVTTTVDWTNAAYLLVASNSYGNSNGSVAREFAVLDAGAINSLHRRSIAQTGNNVDVRANNAGSGEFNAETGFVAENSMNIRAMSFNGSSSGIISTSRNGVPTVGSSGSGVNPVIGGILRLLYGSATNIALGDFLVSASTDAPTQQKLEGFIAWKRGIQSLLPSSHPYRHRRPIYKEWSPSDSASLVDWYDARDLTSISLSGNNIETWLTKTASGNNLTSGAIKPTYTGDKVVFNSAAQLTKTSITTGAVTQGSFAIYAVAAHDLSATSYIFNITDGSAGPGATIRGVTPNSLFVYVDPAAFTAHPVPSAGYIPGSNMIFGLISSGVGANTLAGSFNGAMTVATGTTNRFTGTTYIMGRTASSALDSISELIIVNSADTELCRKIEGYLAWRHTMIAALDSSHPYKNRPPLTTD